MVAQTVELQKKIACDSHLRKKVQFFLDCIARGSQSEAEAMLLADNELALASGDVTDHANRTFKNITGFQYAVWALDWKMWSMLRRYLPLEAVVEQAIGFTQGSWVKEHGVHTNWNTLIDALEIFADKCEFRLGYWSWDQLGKHWVEQVGSAQFKLPMHVLQEYNNLKRPFEPCPDFSSSEYALERSLPDWLITSIKVGKFDFGIIRSSCSVAKAERVMSVGELIKKAFSDGRDWTVVMESGRGGNLLTDDNINHDRVALIRVYNTRIKQREQLIKNLLEEESKAEAEAERFGRTYLDNYKTTRKQCTLHLFSQAPQSLVFEQAPALIFEKNSFELIVNTSAGLQKIKAPIGIESKTLSEFFEKNKVKKKISLSSDDPVIKWIKQSGGHNSSFIDVNNNTALHDVAMRGQVALIETLARYEDYNAQNRMGLTPILLAAQYGKLEMVMALLSKAPTSAIAQTDLLSVLVSNKQELILNKILQRKNLYEGLLVNVGKFYLKNKDNEPDIKLMKEAAVGQMYKTAIEVKSIAMLTFLIQIHPEGLNVLYQKQAPLHYAIQTGFTEGVYLLVDKGSDLALQNAHEITPLELAKTHALDMVNYFVNEEQKAKDRKEEIAKIKIEIEENRIKFVKEFLESFCKEKLPQQKTVLQNDENLGRLKEVLTLAIKGVKYDNWFVSKEYPKLTILMKILNKMLTQKIQQNALTKRRMIGCDLFKKKELLAALQGVVNYDWQSIAIQPVEIEEWSEDMVFKMLSPTQVLFCEHFEKQFDEAYSYFRGLHSGELVSKKDLEEKQKIETLKVLALTAAPKIPVPTPIGNVSIPAGAVVSGVLTLMQYFREYYSQKEAARMVDLFRAVTPHERAHFIRYTAEQIADKYRNQIHHLMPGSEGVEVFAQCVAARVVEYITSDDSHTIGHKPSISGELIRRLKSWVLKQEIPPELQEQKSLYDIFLDGIIRVTSKFPTDKYRLQTINHLTLTDNWCSKEIFENTGIITSSGERYSLPQVNIKSYGYCYGTVKEAQARGLSSGPKEGELWGFGRQWEQVLQTKGLDALPTNHVAQSRPLIFSTNIHGVESAETPKEKEKFKHDSGIKKTAGSS